MSRRSYEDSWTALWSCQIRVLVAYIVLSSRFSSRSSRSTLWQQLQKVRHNINDHLLETLSVEIKVLLRRPIHVKREYRHYSGTVPSRPKGKCVFVISIFLELPPVNSHLVEHLLGWLHEI